MNQIVVTLESGANTSLLRKMIENMKGVLNTRIRSTDKVDKNANKWLEQLKNLRDSIDTSVIDYNDDKTNYILSK